MITPFTTQDFSPPSDDARSTRRCAFNRALALMCAFGALAASGGNVHGEDTSPLVLKAAAVHVGDGTVIEDAIVVLVGGRISAVGAGVAIPPDARIIDLPGMTITPGLIDSRAVIDNYDLRPTPTSSLRMEEQRGAWPNLARPGDGAPPWAPPAQTQESAAAQDSDAGHAHDAFVHQMLRDPADARELRLPGDAGDTMFLSADAHVQPGHDELTCELCGGTGLERQQERAMASGVRFGMQYSEDSAEVIPHTRMLDAIDLHSPDLERLLAQGVTTIFVGGDPGAVISSQGTVLRTGGLEDGRVLKPVSDVRAVMGEDSFSISRNRPPWGPIDFYVRRPTTRMGVAWVFKKALADARNFQAGVPLHGADTPPADALPYLLKILSGDIPLRVQARRQHDIETAVRLCDEFGLKFLLEEGTEAYRCLDLLKEKQVPVVYGPLYEEADRGMRRFEGVRSRLYTFQALLDSGIPTALTAQELREEDGLARQVMYAVRFGVKLGDALKAVTSTPAKFLRVDKELGTVEAGKRADLVVWSGEPFASTSRPLMVLVDGRVEVDRRTK